MSLAAQGVVIRRGGSCLLDGASLDVRPGELLCVLGPNGAGKSTLVNALAGDLRLSSGQVSCDGRDLSGLSEAQQANVRAVMAQSQAPVLGFSVADVVTMGWVRAADPVARRVVQERMQACGIGHLAGRPFHTLSGGEQQRAHFARALVQIWRPAGDDSARYLLLDEPTSNLDLVHQQRLLTLARAEARAGVGVLAVLHDLNLAARYADRIALMQDGRVEACGAPQNVLNAGCLTRLYGTPIHVEHHGELDRLVVLT